MQGQSTELICPKCGATQRYAPGRAEHVCEYCGAQIGVSLGAAASALGCAVLGKSTATITQTNWSSVAREVGSTLERVMRMVVFGFLGLIALVVLLIIWNS